MSAITIDHSRAYAHNVWKSYLYQFLLSFQLWWPIWVLYLLNERGLSFAQITTLEGLSWLAMVLAEVPTGVIADRYGRRTSLAIGGAVVALSIFLFGWTDNYVVLLLSYLAWSVGITFRTGADSALLFDSLKLIGREGEFQKLSGRSLAVSAAGVLLGMLAGAPVAAWTDSYVFPILVSAGIAVLSVFVALSMREPHIEGETRHDNYVELIRESVRTAFSVPTVRYALLLSAPIVVGGLWATGIFTQPFLDAQNVKLESIGILQAPNQLLGIAGALLAYKLARMFGLRLTLAAIPAALIGAYVVLGLVDSLFVFAMLPATVFFGALSQPVIVDYVHRRIPSGQRATILSVRQLICSLAIAAVAPVLGIVADARSLQAAFLGLAVVVAFCAPILLLWHRADRREQAVDTGHAEAPQEAPAAAE